MENKNETVSVMKPAKNLKQGDLFYDAEGDRHDCEAVMWARNGDTNTRKEFIVVEDLYGDLHVYAPDAEVRVDGNYFENARKHFDNSRKASEGGGRL